MQVGSALMLSFGLTSVPVRRKLVDPGTALLCAAGIAEPVDRRINSTFGAALIRRVEPPPTLELAHDLSPGPALDRIAAYRCISPNPPRCTARRPWASPPLPATPQTRQRRLRCVE